MIKLITYFSVIVSVIFCTRIGTVSYAADSGVSIGVTVIDIGPPTINDFDYSALNLSQPVVDFSSVKSTTNDASTNSVASPETTNSASKNGASNSVKPDLSGNSIIYSTLPKEDAGLVKGEKIQTSVSWYKKIVDWCSGILKSIF